MPDFDGLDLDNPIFDELEKEEQEAAEAIRIDAGLYQSLTDEMVMGYLPTIFQIGQLEGDYIGNFNAKANDKGITVKDDYIHQLWENWKPVPGVDLRSGEYGIEYAGAGFFHAACQFYDKGDKENALRNLEKAIELCPYHIHARSLKSKIHHENGDLWLALAETENAILLNPVSIAEKDSESMRVLEKYPESFRRIMGELLAQEYFNKGAVFFDLHHHEEALTGFNEAIRRDPGNFEFISWRQKVNMLLEHWEDALADADTLVVAEYDLEQTYQYRGISLKAMERYWEALEDFNAAIKLNPGLTYAYLQRAACNLEECFFEAAANDAAIAVEKGLPLAHHYRGQAYYYSGDFTKAIADFDIALKEDPDDEISQGLRERSIEERENGSSYCYKRQNEKGEWEQVSKKDGEVVSILPSEGYQQFLNEYRMDEAEEKGWKIWNWEKKIREPAVGTGEFR